VTLANQ